MVADSRAPGLRLQIVLALAGLMVLAFVPLFFAVASLTRATLRDLREESARSIGRVVAAEVAEARRAGDPALVSRQLEANVGQGGVEAIGIFDEGGRLEAGAGDPKELASMHAPAPPYGEASLTVRGAAGRALDVFVPQGTSVVVARLRTDDDADRAAPLVGLVAIYMSTVALALLIFAYFGLTRLIVRPIDALSRAADRVARGARALEVPRAGAREVAELGASVREMTARLLADESAMRSKVAELTQATERLRQTQAQLVRSERLASVGRLAAGVAHEIGNPVAALMGMQDLMSDGDLPAETQRDFVLRMKRETERIHSILRDLLDFARPEEPVVSQAAPLTPAEVGPVIEDVLALARPQKTFKAVELRSEVERDLPNVALSAQRLTQVLLNLVLNAGAALGPSGGAGKVTIRAEREDSKVRVSVEDSGPGIAAEIRDRLFEPFATTKEVGAGTGLGLAVCRGIVQSAGGDITLDESYAPGARFVIRLPQAS